MSVLSELIYERANAPKKKYHPNYMVLIEIAMFSITSYFVYSSHIKILAMVKGLFL